MPLEELFGKLFKDSELSEEAQGKIVAVFEAKVKEAADKKLEEAKETLKKEFDEKLEEEKESLAESVDAYMNRVSEKWLEENKISIVEQTKIDLSENLFEDMKEVLAKHNVELPKGKEDLIEKKEKEIEAITEKYNESEKTVTALQKTVDKLEESHVEFKKGLVFEDVTKELADTQKEKIKSLVEDIEYEGAKDYKGKIEAVIDSIEEETTTGDEDDPAKRALDEEIQNKNKNKNKHWLF